MIGLNRWRKARWGIGNKPQHNGASTRDPLTHLPSSHMLSPLSLRNVLFGAHAYAAAKVGSLRMVGLALQSIIPIYSQYISIFFSFKP